MIVFDSQVIDDTKLYHGEIDYGNVTTARCEKAPMDERN